MTSPHLILHKVRGEPAFDIAEPMEVNGETWWIIPTSGHRAYPYQSWALESLNLSYNGELPITLVAAELNGKNWLANWPDHYSVNDTPTHRERLSLEDLGL